MTCESYRSSRFLEVSVDRTHLALQHGCFHTGQDSSQRALAQAVSVVPSRPREWRGRV